MEKEWFREIKKKATVRENEHSKKFFRVVCEKGNLFMNKQ